MNLSDGLGHCSNPGKGNDNLRLAKIVQGFSVTGLGTYFEGRFNSVRIEFRAG